MARQSTAVAQLVAAVFTVMFGIFGAGRLQKVSTSLLQLEIASYSMSWVELSRRCQCKLKYLLAQRQTSRWRAQRTSHG